MKLPRISLGGLSKTKGFGAVVALLIGGGIARALKLDFKGVVGLAVLGAIVGWMSPNQLAKVFGSSNPSTGTANAGGAANAGSAATPSARPNLTVKPYLIED